MKKAIVSFVCQECGYESSAYLGKCPECGQWNTLKEFRVSNAKSSISKRGENNLPQTLVTIGEVKSTEKERISTGFKELDGVFGGGIVNGSVTLLAGDPGIGKSTLLLQTAVAISQGNSTQKTNDQKNPSKSRVLYISAEESAEQIKLRYERLSGKRKSDSVFVVSLDNTDFAVELIEKEKPTVVVIDSIQTMQAEEAGGLAGSVSQIRYAAQSFVRLAKQSNIPIIIVGHVTKEGMVAGPMVLSHMVDTVLFLEGEKNTGVRILRSFKNRFGPVDEVGIFTMTENGMEEVSNPSSLFMTSEQKNVPGTILTATLSGSRVLLVEIQALCVFSKLPMPRRVSIGVDPRRLELLLAVLQKHCNLPFGTMDVFVNVAGGLKLSDPATDVAICLALYSSIKNVALANTVGIAEVGLLGELRLVPQIKSRIKEAKRLGFTKIVSCESHKYLVSVIQSLDKK